MNIGTITFHWATNYGAVIQAYALQKYLKLNNYETEIIDYIPLQIKLIQTLSNIKNLRVIELIKEIRFKQFRKKYLKISKKCYYTNLDLVKNCHNYDVYICGSDQIWNEPFLLNSENTTNLSYYLNFVKKHKVRISYATSFGTNKISSNTIDLIKPELNRFNYISVRENSGKEIVENMGLNVELVIDPTLLLEGNIYESLFKDLKIRRQFQFFSYILHNNQNNAIKIDNYILNKYFNNKIEKRFDLKDVGVVEWLYHIKNSRFVSTNSFHGTVFAIIFNKPFIVMPVENSGMNDRITTLLTTLGLENRIISSFDESRIDILFEEPINWEQINVKVERIRKKSEEFLERALQNLDN